MNIRDKNLYFIGGVVRDEILGKKSFDIDLTYVGNAIEFVKNLDGVEIVQINEPFGTVKIKFDNQEIDIASSRKESYPRKGHLPKVEKIACSLKEDVLRRDFTINSLARNTLTGEIVDYTGGLEDIKNKKLKVLHDESFIDDPTRIVRALKFSVRFGFDLDNHTKKLQDKYLQNINYDMSLKRLQKELKETFDLNLQSAFEKFVNQGIYKLITEKEFILPSVNFENLINKYKPANVWIIYAGQIPDIEKLPLNKTEQKIVYDFNFVKDKIFSSDIEIFKTFSEFNLETVIMFSAINEKIALRYLDYLKNTRLKITGEDLIKMGFPPNEEFRKCFEYILSEKFKNSGLTKSDELSLAEHFFTKS